LTAYIFRVPEGCAEGERRAREEGGARREEIKGFFGRKD